MDENPLVKSLAVSRERVPELAFTLMLAGILVPTAMYSFRLTNPSPAELLVAVSIAHFASVLFLWIMDATGLLPFRAACRPCRDDRAVLAALSARRQRWRKTQKGDFTFEPVDGFFDRLLPVYLDVAKFIMGLAAGGIALVVGASALGQTKRLPQAYADPLFLLATSIFYRVLFVVLLVLNYEAFRHQVYPYSRIRYIRNRVLGYSALACFFIGYGWLIWAATG